MKILEFSTQAEAAAAVAIINAAMATKAQQLGYDYVEGEGVIGKNAATGQPQPDKQKTTTFDIVKQSPDNSWYFTDPRQPWPLEDGPALISLLQQYNIEFEEKEIPQQWIIRENI